MADIDRLAEMIANLQRHIEERAEEIAAPRIREANEVSAATVAEAQRQARESIRRKDALVDELRAQLGHAEKARARRDAEIQRLKAALAERGEQP